MPAMAPRRPPSSRAWPAWPLRMAPSSSLWSSRSSPRGPAPSSCWSAGAWAWSPSTSRSTGPASSSASSCRSSRAWRAGTTAPRRTSLWVPTMIAWSFWIPTEHCQRWRAWTLSRVSLGCCHHGHFHCAGRRSTRRFARPSSCARRRTLPASVRSSARGLWARSSRSSRRCHRMRPQPRKPLMMTWSCSVDAPPSAEAGSVRFRFRRVASALSYSGAERVYIRQGLGPLRPSLFKSGCT
mmetsp:Transcript_92746/g.300059  ORF Transcript_92746/g.300059 Transcript_92746/m.300059 type:complete len:239 (+) Transcript_92746:541-1257(+)